MSKKGDEDRDWKELRDESFNEYVAGKRRQELRPMTPNQGVYLEAMRKSIVTICTGPAGTGKTFLACGLASQMFKDKQIERIVLTRPLQECDEDPGTVPGDLWEKIVDMMVPMVEALEHFFTPFEVERMRREKTIDFVPMSKMRGRTFRDSFVILDEAQNASHRQLKMFLTRFGEKSRVVVGGDPTQSDLPYAGHNSLSEVVLRFEPDCHKDIRIVRLGNEDIVRHPLIRWIAERLEGPVPAAHHEAYNPSDEDFGPTPSYSPHRQLQER